MMAATAALAPSIVSSCARVQSSGVGRVLKQFDLLKGTLPACEQCGAAVRLLQTIRAEDSIIRINAANKAMQLCGRDRQAVELIFKNIESEATEASFIALLQARLIDGDLEAACRGAHLLLALQHLLPRSRSIGLVLRGCCSDARGDLAMPLWEAWKKRNCGPPGPTDWDAMLQLLAGGGLSAELGQLLQEIKNERVPLTEEAVAALLVLLNTRTSESRALASSDVEYHALLSTVIGASREIARNNLRLLGASGAGKAETFLQSSPKLERTVAMIKPDAVASGVDDEIARIISAAGFEVLQRRRHRFDEAAARTFLSVSWGSAAGDPRRRFFQDMVAFYTSGEVVALLLQREDAIATWRALLGPGDPSVARSVAPLSVRARLGTNKQANAAHGADSPLSARREIELLFGEEWCSFESCPEP